VQQELARLLSSNGIPSIARGYSLAPVPRHVTCCVEYDDSVVQATDFFGIAHANLEIKTKKLDGLVEYDRVVPRLLSLLRYMNFRVNESTGLHVSLGVADDLTGNDRFVRSLLNLFYRFEQVLLGLVAPHRRYSGYAAPIPDLRILWRGASDARIKPLLRPLWRKWCGLNLLPLFEPSQPGAERIEARWLEGSLNNELLRNWIVLLNRMVDHASTHDCKTPAGQVRNDRQGFNSFCLTTGLRANNRLYPSVAQDLVLIRRYFLRRWRRLATLEAEPVVG
jgi:hypothetical protein